MTIRSSSGNAGSSFNPRHNMSDYDGCGVELCLRFRESIAFLALELHGSRCSACSEGTRCGRVRRTQLAKCFPHHTLRAGEEDTQYLHITLCERGRRTHRVCHTECVTPLSTSTSHSECDVESTSHITHLCCRNAESDPCTEWPTIVGCGPLCGMTRGCCSQNNIT